MTEENVCVPDDVEPVEVDMPAERVMRAEPYRGPSSVDAWTRFFHTKEYKDKIGRLNTEGKVGEKTLFVRWDDLNANNAPLAQELVDRPLLVLEHANAAIKNVYIDSLSRGIAKKMGEKVKDVKINVRPIGLLTPTNVRDLRDEHVEKLIRVDVTVRNVTEVLPFIRVAVFECARCKGQQGIPQETNGKFIEPTYCSCDSEKKGVFRLIYSLSERDNYQRLKVQEHPDELRGGERAENLDVNITGDMVRMVMAGERIIVNGIIRVSQRKNKEGKTPFFDMYMDAVSIEKQENEYADIEITPEDVEWIKKLGKDPELENKIIKSIAPSIFGYEDVKLAIAHQMFAGGEFKLPDGNRTRGDIHILLVGDPGIAKSQILRYVVKISPRGQFASGKSSTSAGLTAAATKDDFDGSWTLEAGAMVLADKGLLAVDEMDKMDKENRSSLHEGMEQQTISIHKAGINAELKCRCSVLGAANPKFSHFDPFETIADQIDMPSTLLSRFDLIFPLQDKANEKRDMEIAEHILRTRLAAELMVDMTVEDPRREAAMKKASPEIPPDRLKKYIAYSKRFVHPVLSNEAMDRLKMFYTNLRQSKIVKDGQTTSSKVTDSPMPITARQLEGGARLAEASARMRLSNVVTLEDMNRAIRIISACLKQVATDEHGNLDANRLTGDMTADQRTRIKGLKEVLKAVKLENPNGVPREVLLQKVQEAIPGMTEDKFDKELRKLKEVGEVFEPKNGLWSLS